MTSSRKALGQLWRSYRYGAKRRGFSWGLTRGEFDDLVGRPCHYCGGQRTQTLTWRESMCRYTGLDRWNNLRGYEPGNVVACCGKCNMLKGTLSGEEFLDAVLRVVCAQTRACARPA